MKIGSPAVAKQTDEIADFCHKRLIGMLESPSAKVLKQVLAASEAAFLDALADPIIQDEAERFLNGGVNAGKSDDQEGDAEVHRFVPGMN